MLNIQMKNSTIKSKKAFTLAEVLITLGIVSVVAVIMINAVQQYQKTQYAVQLKKAYTITNQALIQMASDYGCVGDLQCTGLFASTLSNQHYVLGEALIKYFNLTKNCKTATNNGCWISETNQYYDGSYTGINPTYDAQGIYKFITADGMSFAIVNYKNDCDTYNYSTHRVRNMEKVCGFITIDVNGLKKPNLYGRDTFLFWITNQKGPLLYPRGGADDAWDGASAGVDYWWKDDSGNVIRCNPTSKNGYHCAGRIMEEGWQMNY